MLLYLLMGGILMMNVMLVALSTGFFIWSSAGAACGTGGLIGNIQCHQA